MLQHHSCTYLSRRFNAPCGASEEHVPAPSPSSVAQGPGAIDLAVVSRHIAMRALRREVTRTGSKFYGGNEMLTKTRLLPSNFLQHRPFLLLVTKQWQRLCAAPASHVTSLPREPSDCVRLFH